MAAKKVESKDVTDKKKDAPKAASTPAKSDAPAAGDISTQAQEQTGQRQVRINIDERDMTTQYTNAFRTNSTADEVMLDFGLNTVVQNPQGGQGQQIQFKVNDRVILNHYTAKRLAITLGQLIRRHEDQFGELQLDASKRQK